MRGRCVSGSCFHAEAYQREFCILTGPRVVRHRSELPGCELFPRSGRLLQAGLQGFLQIRAAWQPAGAHSVNTALNTGRIRCVDPNHHLGLELKRIKLK